MCDENMRGLEGAWKKSTGFAKNISVTFLHENNYHITKCIGFSIENKKIGRKYKIKIFFTSFLTEGPVHRANLEKSKLREI